MAGRGQDARIGEHEIDAAELRDTTGDRLGQSVAVADVAALDAFFGEPDGVGPPPDPGPRR